MSRESKAERTERLRRTVAMVAVSNAGIRTGTKAVVFLVSWGVVTDELGHPATMREYVEWWKASTATAYRDKAAFEKAFPSEAGPERLWSVVRDYVESRERAGAFAQGMAAPWG